MGPSILFVNLPPRPIEDLDAAIRNKDLLVSVEHEITMPLGIMYLSSYVKKNNNVGDVRLLDYVIELKNIHSYNDIDEFIEKPVLNAAGFTPDIISISLIFSTSYHFFQKFIRKARELWPSSYIIVGGTHATSSYQLLLKDTSINAVIRGEGELPLSDLVGKFPDHNSRNIQGLITIDDLDQMTENGIAEFITDLDLIPFPDRGLVDMESYVNARGSRWEVGNAAAARMAVLVTTRGCPYRCTFCSSHTVHGRRLRRRSIGNVIAEITELHDKYGVTLFIPWDDMFTAGKKRTLDLLSQIRSLDIPDLQIQFQNGLSINSLDEDIVDSLVLTGMPMTALAIESGSEFTQKYLIKKHCNLEKARKIVAYMKSRNVFVRCLYILGFPRETKELMQETISYARSVQADWSVFSIASPLLGSEMYNQFVGMGVIEDTPSTWGRSTYSERTFDMPEISAQELNDLAYRANLECNFLFNPNFLKGDYDRALKLYTDITFKFPFHVVAWYCILRCYKKMGQTREAAEIEAKLRALTLHNSVGKEMFLKYKDLMPEINFTT
ncbi:MAG: cobalamin-dependent protein [Methanoregula sp.]|nr:cobalamin-dependent protein [Methanoregula sp.]